MAALLFVHHGLDVSCHANEALEIKYGMYAPVLLAITLYAGTIGIYSNKKCHPGSIPNSQKPLQPRSP